MTIKEKNIIAIKEKNEKLYNNLIKIEESYKPDLEVEVELARDGSDILSVIMNDRKFSLNSTYKPQSEAENFVRKYEKMPNEAVLVFLGLGNSIIAKELLKMSQKDAVIFFFEPSLSIFMKAIEVFDYTEILKEDRVKIFVAGLNVEDFELYLNANMNHMNVNFTYIESLPKYKEIFPQDFVWMYKAYEQQKKIIYMDINTRIKVRKEFMINPIYNLEYTFHAKSSADFKKIFNEEIPAVIVSAGPSLEKNVHDLKRAKGKVFIFAVDTAARFLLDQGVEPDMVVALDYSKPLYMFEDERLKHIPLVILTDFNHKVMELLDGNDFIFGSTDLQLYHQYFTKFDHSIEGIPQGGSVATFAFALLHYWGINKIILIGQDLALTENQLHAGEGEAKQKDIERRTIEVDGNIEEKVYTTPDFYAYLRWFEMAVLHYYGKDQIINATEGGAKIKGTKIMPLKDALDLYCDKEYNFAELFQSIPYLIEVDQYQEAYSYLYAQRKEINTLKKQVIEGKNAAERAITLVKRRDIAGKEFKKLNKTLDNVCKFYEESPMSQLVSKASADTEIASILDLYIEKDDQNEEMIRLYEKLKLNYTQFDIHIDEIILVYDKVMERIKNKYNLVNV